MTSFPESEAATSGSRPAKTASGRQPDKTGIWAFIVQSDPVIKILTGFLILAIWEVGARAFAAPFVARPGNILLKVPEVVSDPAYWAATWSTIGAVLIGLLIALVVGTLVGLMMGRIRAADRMLDFYVNGFYAMPMVAALPLLTVWFGYNEEARLATIVFAALFSVIINVGDGARSVPHHYLEVGQSFRAPAREIWFGITLLSSLPYVIAGVRLAAGRSLVGAVLAEIFASVDGLGMFILANARGLRQNEAVVGVLMLAAFGLLFEFAMNWVLKRYFPWYRRDEQKGD